MSDEELSTAEKLQKVGCALCLLVFVGIPCLLLLAGIIASWFN